MKNIIRKLQFTRSRGNCLPQLKQVKCKCFLLPINKRAIGTDALIMDQKLIQVKKKPTLYLSHKTASWTKFYCMCFSAIETTVNYYAYQ